MPTDNPLSFGNRTSTIPPSGTLEVTRKVRALRRQGIDIVSLAGGAPEPGPDCLATPFKFPVESNVLGDPAGEMDLRTAIAAKLERDQGLIYDPETEVVVTIGAKQGVYASLLALIEPGDEVLVLDPCWVSYAPAVRLAGGVPRVVPFVHGGEYFLDGHALAARVNRRTRAVILNTPHNPTGRVFSGDELAAAARVVSDHGLWVLTDESFDKFVFDGHQHLSIASLAGMRARTIVLQSFSKAFALPGIRVGYLAAPSSVCQAVARLNEHLISCVSPLAQSIALAALADEPSWTHRLRDSFLSKRNIALEGLSNIRGMSCTVPEGTFYVFPDISAFGSTSSEFASRLLDQARVAVTPGSAFGAGAENHIRINLVGPVEALREGLERLRRVLD